MRITIIAMPVNLLVNEVEAYLRDSMILIECIGNDEHKSDDGVKRHDIRVLQTC